jgi:predicted Zn-dependent protease
MKNLLLLIAYINILLISACVDKLSPELKSTDENPVLNKRVFPKFSNEKLLDILQKEVALTEVIDQAPNNHDWLASYPSDNSSLKNFCDNYEDDFRRALNIQLIGSFPEIDKSIFDKSREFLQAFHGIKTDIIKKTITMNDIKEKTQDTINKLSKDKDSTNSIQSTQQDLDHSFPDERSSYLVEIILEYLDRESNKNKPYMMSFTNDDIFMRGFNFVFGAAIFSSALSTARFGTEPKTLLLRALKIATHEFAHQRGLRHCAKHECNIGGYMHLGELDSRPLYFCSKDTAKICWLNKQTMLEYYQNYLPFLKRFAQQNNLDLNKEIQHTERKLAILEKAPIYGL